MRAPVEPVQSIELLTSADLAALLKIPPKSLHNATAAGLIPRGVKIAGVGLRWRRAEVDEWLREQFERGRGT